MAGARALARRVTDDVRRAVRRAAEAVVAVDRAENDDRDRSRRDQAVLTAHAARVDTPRRARAAAEHDLHLAEQRLAALDGHVGSRDSQVAGGRGAMGEPASALQDVLATRRALLAAGQARQVDVADVRLAANPASYLTDLLGNPSHDNPIALAAWRTRARAVEDWRHRVLGLPHGEPASPDSRSATERALGAPPADPAMRERYEGLAPRSASVDLTV